MAANVKFFINAYGNVVYGEEGASYDSQPLRKIRLKTDASYKDLLNAIYTKIEIDTSAHQINKVLHRHPKFVGGRVHYSLVPIQDDSDVEDLIEMAEKMGEGSIQELYIEISNGPLALSPNIAYGIKDGNRTFRTSEASNPTPGQNHEEFSTNTKGGDGKQTSRAHSSTTPPGKNYEVFLSFRGEDTRHGQVKHEAELLQIVVNEVLKVLGKKALRVSAHLVGVESHVEKIIERIKNAERSSDVQAVIVHGMGGIGKTTLAKVVYNRLYDYFERCSFIEHIREASQQYKGKEDLQKQLISNISGQRQIDIKNIDEGTDIIKARCEGKKVLILLDDVDHKDQVNALAGEPNWFGRGSIIIITSRSMDVIQKWKSSFFYELDSLDTNQSFLLFKKHAFKENGFCLDEHGTLAKDIISTTGGLPLAIEIVGSYLHGQRKDIWEDTLKMLKGIPHDDVQKKLKLSFDALHPDEKAIFLDIACLPIHEDRELAIYMWERCSFSKQRVNNLVSMAMIKYGEKSKLLIHDQLRDLGREIVRQESSHNPGNRSRIWKEEDAWKVLESKQVTPNVEALVLEGSTRYTSQQFEGLLNLRSLQLNGVILTGDFKNICPNLIYFEWFCSLGYITDIVEINFAPKNLVVLNLSRSNIREDWQGWNQLEHLKVLKLQDCPFISTTPDFLALKKLEVLTLSYCRSLRSIHPSIGKLSKTLKVLEVSDCIALEELPIEVGRMEELRKLHIHNTSISKVPIVEGYLTKLETIIFQPPTVVSSHTFQIPLAH